MYKLLILSVAIAAAAAVTPFFESPHNEKASAFYKTPAPAHGAPVYSPPAAPAPIYKPKPVYKPEYPAPAPAYKPSYAAAPAYKPEPYQPSYKPSGGATSYQNVKLEAGGQAYKPEYKPQY